MTDLSKPHELLWGRLMCLHAYRVDIPSYGVDIPSLCDRYSFYMEWISFLYGVDIPAIWGRYPFIMG